MAELVDAPASGAGILTGVEVRVFFWAPQSKKNSLLRLFFYVYYRPIPSTNIPTQQGFQPN